MSIDFTKPPSTRPYFHMSGDKWDMDYQRNALLHFVEAQGLSDKCLDWLYTNAPEGWFREDEEDK